VHYSEYTVKPETLRRDYWLSFLFNAVNVLPFPDRFVIDLSSIEDISKLEPFHFATLACLIEHYHRRRCSVVLKDAETPAGQLLLETLQWRRYWAGGENYAKSKDDKLLNLWRIKDDEKELHTQRVHDYLKSTFFQNKDLSAVKNSLVEAYYNVFDHAEAEGNAFSFIKYDEKEQKLYVAVCDFGIGIAAKVRGHFPDIATDHEAIEKAMEDKFTTHSSPHNAGFGLGNIRMACTEKDALRIVSNHGFLYANRKEIVSDPMFYDFKGTLVYYELSLSHFDDEEIITNFEL
jgi:anti-sigma regulatory factor (Ser/Thr protein kinase)